MPPHMQNVQGDTHASPPVPTDGNAQHAPPRVRRRNRQITSCLECRRRKLKCDKNSPCLNCTKIARPCIFIASSLDAEAQRKLAEVKEKMGDLERSLEEDVLRRSKSRSGHSSDRKRNIKLPGQEESYSDQEEDEDTRDLNPSNFISEDAVYYEGDADDDMVDLGIAMGRVRITERIGGLVRPRFADEMAQALKELPKSEHPRPNPVLEQDPREWLAPSRDYVAPSSSFFFAPGIEKTSLTTFLPSRSMVDKLIAHYWEAVHVVAKAVHRPSFERQLENFWSNVTAGIEPRLSFQAVVFAALLSSIVSMPESRVTAEFGVDKHSLVDNFRSGTESALARANFLRTTKMETLQAFVMYLIVLCRSEVSRAHSALTGTVIRLAECMGLHRDPSIYSTSPVEIQVRRTLWYQICFLDLRTSEATGPRPQIRHDDYDTRFPLNLDDEDLDRAENGDDTMDARKDSKQFTDATLVRMRFECYEMHRFLWSERPKLDQRRANGERKVTLVSLLARVQSFKAAMEKIYLPMLRKGEPSHALASEIYGILSDRFYILLLQKYLSSARKMPDRLRQLVMSAAVSILEHSMVIEQQPALSMYSWYVGALHQYHPTLLLLNELYAGYNEPEVEDRVWKCLDFAFGLPPGGSNIEKTRYILEELVEKSRIYAGMKRVRVPNNMPQPQPRKHTPGYKAREQEERARSGSVPSDFSSPPGSNQHLSTGYAAQRTPSPQATRITPQQPNLSQRLPNQAAISFPGAIPEVDWGTLDLPTDTLNLQQPVPQSSLFNFNEYVPTPSAASQATANTLLHPGSDGSSPNTAAYGAYGAATDTSPMDVMNEIDWSEIEKMFGAETGPGMMITPYSFPTFEPGDLNI
ncbi:hypothetical protein HBI25_097790 [Parastagonospora nodorum]|nr:hypothetical protein HBH52_214750 [Parastagonospora nodorum]KAH4084007.1 hypothetical protein HBH46_216240 [Parastagonospora nodorum]KAH4114346.1 hypothetical protein HBH47_196500 [Parastagonospora nodorum]KAH4153694.1 hypothetical protein HBH43_222710 [Parastagonospora nodorum]KAH4187670.1 hypothetical protein HBI95_233200 [Parastagonospora nodorum]